MTAPAIDLPAIEQATRMAVAQGHRVFQPHRFADSDRDHVEVLLEWLDPPPGSRILDAGCGIGEVSRMMGQFRPDLTFVLANLSNVQLEMCPQGERYAKLPCDCHQLPLEDASVDCVMFSAALVQMDQLAALTEARRVTKAGGVLLVNEMVRTADIPTPLEQVMGLRVPTEQDLLAAIRTAGWVLHWTTEPVGDDAHFRHLLAQNNLEHFADCVKPLAVRAFAKG